MANQQLGTNTFTTAKWIVSATASDGTHTTIAGALTSASSGDTIFIRPGTYTENLTLKAGVNLTAFGSDSSQNGTGHVIISGTCTLTTAGSVSISGIQLQTNSAALLAVTGSAASIVNLENCYLNMSNNTGITFSTSSGSAKINLLNCSGDLGTTGIGIFAHSSGGVLFFNGCYITNSGASTTASTISAGTLTIFDSTFFNPITSSGTATWGMTYSNIDSSAQNATCATCGGSGTHTLNTVSFTSGSASAVSISNTTLLPLCYFNSSNTNAITGAGTAGLSLPLLVNSRKMNVTTLIDELQGTFTPSIAFGGGTTGITYSTQEGIYVRIGSLVFVYISIVLTSKGSSTGALTIEGLPFSMRGSGTGVWPCLTVSVTLTAFSPIWGRLAVTGTSVSMLNGSAGLFTTVTDTQVGNSSEFHITGFYYTY